MQTLSVARRPVLDILPLSIWVLHIALPAFGLWLLLDEPKFDVTWGTTPPTSGSSPPPLG
jgi:hypothetical protein